MDDYQHDSFYPTYYMIGGQWAFTCIWCKQFTFGYSSKAFAEDGMLDHYDCCSAFPAQWKNPVALQLRNEVQDMGVGCAASARNHFRNTYGSIR